MSLTIKEPITWSRWYDLATAAYSSHSLTCLAFVAATAFSHVIREQQRCFPILFLDGPSMSGKSTFARSIASFFVPRVHPVPMDQRSVTVTRLGKTLGRWPNVPVILDEIGPKTKSGLLDVMKHSYDGSYSGATLGLSLLSYFPVTQTIIASGQLPLKDLALIRRCLILNFEPLRCDRDQNECLRALKAFEEYCSSLLPGLVMHGGDVLRGLGYKRDELYNQLLEGTSLGASPMMESIIGAHATLYAPIALLLPITELGTFLTEEDIVSNMVQLIEKHPAFKAEAAEKGGAA